MRLSILTPLAIATLALGASACGDDKLSKEELGKKADAICKDYENKVEAVNEPANIQDADQAATYLKEVSPIVDEGVAKLKDLKPSDDVKSDWDAFIAKQEEGAQVVSKAKDKADAKDASGLKDLRKLSSISAAAKTSARKAGASGCAESS